MKEYSYENIIFNPTFENIRNYIGKMVYYADSPSLCLKYANNNNTDHAAILTDVISGNDKPFYFGAYRERAYGCIIPKKEYSPFYNIEEFIEASLEHNKNHFLSKVGGLWLKSKEDETICLITNINENTNYLHFNFKADSLDDIFYEYCFLDDTPCGKLKESK